MKTYSESTMLSAPQRHSLNGVTMGTRYTAVFYVAGGSDLAAIGAALFSAVDKLDRQMSTWNPASDLCRLNAAAENVWVAVPAALAHVLATSVQIGQQSNGAFDIGVGELVENWGFGPSQKTPPAQSSALPAATYRPASARLEMDRARQQVRKLAPIAIDLSGIDGEMRARGSKPGGEAWSVAIEKPIYGLREVAGVMELRDTAIATSGDYRRWVEIAGKRYAHTIDPARQEPVSNRLAAVTVLASSCMLADAWATALLVLGEDAGLALARERGMDALFVMRDGDRLQEVLILGGAVSGG